MFADRQEEPGPLGYGWTFNYHQYLQMYEEFKIVEYRGDGNHQVYNYTENNPDAMVPSYDGAHRLISRTDALGRTATYTYNGEGKVTESGFSYKVMENLSKTILPPSSKNAIKNTVVRDVAKQVSQPDSWLLRKLDCLLLVWVTSTEMTGYSVRLNH